MVWGRGKNKDNVYMKIFTLYTIAYFIYDIKIWLEEVVEVFKHRQNSNSEVVVLHVRKLTELIF